jgi:TM2 domain-containing membrane protein YozV
MSERGEQGKKTEPPAEAKKPVKGSTSKAAVACILAWIVPGAGHLFLGKYLRGIVFLVIVSFLFGFGLYLGGKTYPKLNTEPERIAQRGEGVDFLSYFATFACLGTGPAYFIVRRIPALDYGQGNVFSSTYEYGTTFILVAGLLNFLLILDAFDISLGRKN